MLGVKVYGRVDPDKLSALKRFCDANGAEFNYSSGGEEFFEVYRDVSDRCDFNAFFQSVRKILCETPSHTNL